MKTILILLIVLVAVGGAILVWIMMNNSKSPEVTRKWSDPNPKFRDEPPH